ncbi:SA1362 family protein [Alkalihalobacillus sp. R86527]|uniref:SA1362 family protein n=1 Tax=Alkalihalobacillus sp. R86527 TaxID=3093863 RepID=UPI00366C5785
MSRRVVQPLIYTIIGLAAIGFIWKLFSDPTGLLKQLLITAAIGVIVIMIIRKFMAKKMGKPNSAYQKAAKQSSKLQKKRGVSRKSAPHLRVIPSKRLIPKKRPLNDDKKPNPFTVIEGRKGKKKNRALF